jgi:hypothetical protein
MTRISHKPSLKLSTQVRVAPQQKTSQRLVELPLAVILGTVPTLMLILVHVYG